MCPFEIFSVLLISFGSLASALELQIFPLILHGIEVAPSCPNRASHHFAAYLPCALLHESVFNVFSYRWLFACVVVVFCTFALCRAFGCVAFWFWVFVTMSLSVVCVCVSGF